MPQTELTIEQQAAIPAHVEKWAKVGLSTAPADFDTAEQAVRAMYRAASLPEPKVVLRMDSPFGTIMGGHVTYGILDKLQQVEQQVEQQVWQQVWQQVEQQVWQQVEQQVRQQVRQQVEQQVRQQVRQQVEQQVWQQVEQQVRQQVRQQVEQQVRQQVRQQVGQQVERQVRKQVGQQVWQQVGQQVRQQVWQQVWQQVEQQVEQQVGQQVRQQVEQQVRQQVWLAEIQSRYGLSTYDYRGAALWPSWPAYISFMLDNGFIDASSKAAVNFRLDQTITETCGLVWISNDVAAISDRPETISIVNGRLHCETGPAIRYRDGWELYVWNGTVLPARWVLERETIAPDEILRETDVDVRTAGLACIGLHKLKATHGTLIHDSGDPVTGSLWEIRLPDLPEPGLYLSAQCPRNGEIFEGVMPVSNIDGLPIRTAEAAQAWRRRLPACEFEPSPYRT